MKITAITFLTASFLFAADAAELNFKDFKNNLHRDLGSSSSKKSSNSKKSSSGSKSRKKSEKKSGSKSKSSSSSDDCLADYPRGKRIDTYKSVKSSPSLDDVGDAINSDTCDVFRNLLKVVSDGVDRKTSLHPVCDTLRFIDIWDFCPCDFDTSQGETTMDEYWCEVSLTDVERRREYCEEQLGFPKSEGGFTENELIMRGNLCIDGCEEFLQACCCGSDRDGPYMSGTIFQ